MSPTHTRKAGRLYRYYISQSVMKRGAEACPVRQSPPPRSSGSSSSRSGRCCRPPRSSSRPGAPPARADKTITESDVRGALLEFEPLWNELFPAEQARIVELLVERIDLQPDGIDLRLRVEG